MGTHFQKECLPYGQTGKFTKIVTDYISGNQQLKPFFGFDPTLDGIKKSIEEKKKRPVNRNLLVSQLLQQYSEIADSDFLKNRIKVLLKENVFTVCTAHQPNIFTGHLYFIYKIIHAIKCCNYFSQHIPDCEFVPVFFMGSEDADLDELNHIWLEEEKYTWNTKQTGAVGKMFVDDNLIRLIQQLEGRLLAEPFGKTIADELKACYVKNTSIEQATLKFVHHLFKDFGLVVLLPDNPAFKRVMAPVFKEDLFKHLPHKIVEDTSKKLDAVYKAQAYPRDINLFYMKDDLRNRIVRKDDHFLVHDADLVFSKEELEKELNDHPERFSPNVILRGLFQEMILPDIAFIGGGGELAYWLQLKDLFLHFQVPYPVLILRNSFLIIERKFLDLMEKLGLQNEDLFKSEEHLYQQKVKLQSENDLSLSNERDQMNQFFNGLLKKTTLVDKGLTDHIEALKKKQMKSLDALEKKLLRSEKKKFTAIQNQIHRLLSALAPSNGLQERTENFLIFYAKWGQQFLETVYELSPALEAQFCIIKEK